MPAHAPLAPSKAYIWLQCPGSKHAPPSPSNPAADAGTLAHAACEATIGRGDFSPLALLDLEDAVFAGARTRVTKSVAAEIASAAVTYTTFVEEHTPPGCSPVLEQKIAHRTIPDFFGTVDCQIVDDGLHIIDLKTGRWPAHWEQLACYALLARQENPRDFVTATIVQPREMNGKTLQTFDWTYLDFDHFEDRVVAAAESDDLHAGPHCFFCTLKPTCEAYAAAR